jgi:hypothetical protein
VQHDWYRLAGIRFGLMDELARQVEQRDGFPSAGFPKDQQRVARFAKDVQDVPLMRHGVFRLVDMCDLDPGNRAVRERLWRPTLAELDQAGAFDKVGVGALHSLEHIRDVIRVDTLQHHVALPAVGGSGRGIDFNGTDCLVDLDRVGGDHRDWAMHLPDLGPSHIASSLRVSDGNGDANGSRCSIRRLDFLAARRASARVSRHHFLTTAWALHDTPPITTCELRDPFARRLGHPVDLHPDHFAALRDSVNVCIGLHLRVRVVRGDPPNRHRLFDALPAYQRPVEVLTEGDRARGADRELVGDPCRHLGVRAHQRRRDPAPHADLVAPSGVAAAQQREPAGAGVGAGRVATTPPP